MNKYEDLPKLMERVIHKYNQWEKIKRSYGTDLCLTRAEVHTIAAVGDNPDINVTMLADILGITKGAASQMIYKLVDKGCVDKKVSPVSDTEVVLNLTELGKENYEGHKEYHQKTNEDFFTMLRDMPDTTYKEMLEALSSFEQYIDNRLKEKK